MNLSGALNSFADRAANGVCNGELCEIEAVFPIINRNANGKRDIHGKSTTNFPGDLQIQQWPDAPQPVPNTPLSLTMSGVADAHGTSCLARVLHAEQQYQPTKAEVRHQAAVKAWETRRANAVKREQAVATDHASTLPEPVWSDGPASADEVVLHFTEMDIVLRWLHSWSGVNGHIGNVAVQNRR